MFSKKETKRNLDMAKNVHGTEKAKFDVHVTRMLLGRVKSKSKKDFDVLQNQLLISKSSKSFMDVASRSLAGFRFVVAMENMLKRDLRRNMLVYHRLKQKSRRACFLCFIFPSIIAMMLLFCLVTKFFNNEI